MSKFRNIVLTGLMALLGLPVLIQAQAVKTDFQKNTNGLRYKILSANKDNQKPRFGDLLTLTMTYANDKDSMIFDSRAQDYPFELVYRTPQYKGDLYEAISMLAKGDSAAFILKADSFFLRTIGAPDLPEGIRKGSDLHFNLRLVSIKSQNDYVKEQAVQMKKDSTKLQASMKKEQEDLKKYIEDKKITVKPTASGLYYIELTPGKGPKVEPGKRVKVHYVGYFLDGKEFDSTYEEGQPREWIAGKGKVIKGLEEGVGMMCEGGKARLIMPSVIAYGEKDAGPFPAYTPVVFEVELVEVY